MGGLEEPLFVCLMLWGICLTLKGAEDGRPAVAGAALLAGAALTRPEGAGVAAMTALATACAYRRQIRYAAWLPWAAMFLALFVPYFIWRWSYYGYPVPNSFYAKVGSTGAQVMRGLRYVHESLWVTGYWWLVPAALAVLAVIFWRTGMSLWRRTSDTATRVRHSGILAGPPLLFQPGAVPHLAEEGAAALRA